MFGGGVRARPSTIDYPPLYARCCRVWQASASRRPRATPPSLGFSHAMMSPVCWAQKFFKLLNRSIDDNNEKDIVTTTTRKKITVLLKTLGAYSKMANASDHDDHDNDDDNDANKKKYWTCQSIAGVFQDGQAAPRRHEEDVGNSAQHHKQLS